jgi:hypothetical protein
MTNTRTAQSLNVLVSELIKISPNQKVVQNLMNEQGLTYQLDPIANMAAVLDVLNSIRLEPAITNPKIETEGTL